MTQNGDNNGETEKTSPEPSVPLREPKIIKKGDVLEPPITQPPPPKKD